MPLPVAITELYHWHMSVLKYSTANIEQINEVPPPFLEQYMIDVCVLRWRSNAVKMRTSGSLRRSPEYYAALTSLSLSSNVHLRNVPRSKYAG
jgi:hypothetical protein